MHFLFPCTSQFCNSLIWSKDVYGMSNNDNNSSLGIDIMTKYHLKVCEVKQEGKFSGNNCLLHSDVPLYSLDLEFHLWIIMAKKLELWVKL